MADIKKQKSVDIIAGNNSNITLNKNSNNKKWTKKSIAITLTSTLTLSGLASSTGYLLYANGELNYKVDYILNGINKWVIIELKYLIDNFSKFPANIIKAKLETIYNFLKNVDDKYSYKQEAINLIYEIERKLSSATN